MSASAERRAACAEAWCGAASKAAACRGAPCSFDSSAPSAESGGRSRGRVGGLGLANTHYDPTHTVFVQVAGRKHFVLWPPEACIPYP